MINSWPFVLYNIWLEIFKAIYCSWCCVFPNPFPIDSAHWDTAARYEFPLCWWESIQEPHYTGDNKRFAFKRNHLCGKVENNSVSQISSQFWDWLAPLHATLQFRLLVADYTTWEVQLPTLRWDESILPTLLYYKFPEDFMYLLKTHLEKKTKQLSISEIDYQRWAYTYLPYSESSFVQ